MADSPVNDSAIAVNKLASANNKLASKSINPDLAMSLMEFRAGMGALSGGIMMMSGGINQIAKLNDERMKIIRTVTTAVNVSFAGLMIYITIAQLRKKQFLANMIAAATETTAKVITQDYASIALASATAAGISMSFAGGYAMGQMQSQNINAVGNITSPDGRRKIAATVGGG